MISIDINTIRNMVINGKKLTIPEVIEFAKKEKVLLYESTYEGMKFQPPTYLDGDNTIQFVDINKLSSEERKEYDTLFEKMTTK